MSIVQRRGAGGPRFNDDIVNAALIFAGILLIVFLLLVIRLYFDQKEGRRIVLKPERSPAKVLKRMIPREY